MRIYITNEEDFFSNLLEYLGRGTALLSLKKYNEAIDDFTNAIKSKIFNDMTYQYRGRAYAEHGKFEEALNDYNAYLKRWHESEWTKGFYPEGVYLERGNVYFNLKHYKEAIADYDVEIAANPNNLPALENRGTCYLIVGIYSEAIKDLSVALKMAPNDMTILVKRGRALMLNKNHRDALRDFKKALEKDAKNDQAHYYKCLAMIELGNDENGLADCRTAARLGNQSAQEVLRINSKTWQLLNALVSICVYNSTHPIANILLTS